MKVISTNEKEVEINQEIIDLLEFLKEDNLSVLKRMRENCTSVSMFISKLLCCEDERDALTEQDLKEKLTQLQYLYIEIEYCIKKLK